jgi:hypothetical protein
MSVVPGLGCRRWKWSDCCDAACKHLNPSGNKLTTNEGSLHKCHFLFAQKDTFPHPDPDVMCGKKPVPRLLGLYPELKTQIIVYSVGILAGMTLEIVHHAHVHSSIIPILFDLWKVEEVNAELDLSKDMFLKVHKPKTLSLTLLWRWLRYLGLLQL